jgi:hypothetical protein
MALSLAGWHFFRREFTFKPVTSWPLRYLVPNMKYSFYQDVAINKQQRIMFMKGNNIALSSVVDCGEESCYYSEDIASQRQVLASQLDLFVC